MDRDAFPDWFTANAAEVSFVFGLGQRTDTGEFDFRVLDSLNLSYSKTLSGDMRSPSGADTLYASSAATYGVGEHRICR
jgi:ADP-L-glycero-D-manno-heptose 6-epimerase